MQQVAEVDHSDRERGEHEALDDGEHAREPGMRFEDGADSCPAVEVQEGADREDEVQDSEDYSHVLDARQESALLDEPLVPPEKVGRLQRVEYEEEQEGVEDANSAVRHRGCLRDVVDQI